MTAVALELRSIAAKGLWKGRRRGEPIPGVGEFDRGVGMLRRAAARGGREALGRLDGIASALDGAEAAVAEWRRDVAGFAVRHLEEAAGPAPDLGPAERCRAEIRCSEGRRLVRLIAAYDAGVAETLTATARAHARRVWNPHHASIKTVSGRIRHVVDLGYAALVAARRARGEGNGT